MLKQKSCIGLFMICVLALALTGCVRYPDTSIRAMRIESTALEQPYPLESRRLLIHRLTALRVQVVELGDRLRIILPIDRFFDVEKSKFRASKEPILVLISKLALLYGNSPIFVQGYSDNLGYEADNIARTTLEARQVAAILWSYGVDQRRMIVRGYGSRFPIADNRSMEGRRYNRRIEINL